jgi:hypothetical protein
MARRIRDPYQVLGVSPDVSDAGLRAAYRRLVKLHHPDHNGGSPEAARRFEEVQKAYAQITRVRDQAGRPRANATPPPAADPAMDSRLADLERQVREAQEARERAMRAAAEAAAKTHKRPSDEELGYVRTDDSLSKLLADAGAELSQRLAGGTGRNAKSRAADLLEELAARLRREDAEG